MPCLLPWVHVNCDVKLKLTDSLKRKQAGGALEDETKGVKRHHLLFCGACSQDSFP